MNKQTLNRLRPYIDVIKAEGFSVQSIARGAHIKVRTTEGPIFVCPMSASDNRAIHNFRACVRRHARERDTQRKEAP